MSRTLPALATPTLRLVRSLDYEDSIMDPVRFFDLLGVSDSLTAAELWPRGQVQPAAGVLMGDATRRTFKV